MLTVYTILAIGGGVFLIVQLVLTLMGMDSDGDLEIADDADIADHDATWFFNVISVRSLIAALTFFGVGGRIGDAAGLSAYPVLLFAMIIGAVAMFFVAWCMHLLINLRTEGTVHIGQAMGEAASVYVPIPPNEEGYGKIFVTLGNQTREYRAVSGEPEELSTGVSVVVVDVIDQETVKVKRGNPLRTVEREE